MGQPSTSYRKKLADPRWQKKRLEIFERDEFACQLCGATESTLHIHHKHYSNYHHDWADDGETAPAKVFDEPWTSLDDALVTLCKACHEEETERMEEVWGLVTAILRENFTANGLWEFFVDQGRHKEFIAQSYGQQPRETRLRERRLAEESK